MKIIKRNSDNVVIYVGDTLTLDTQASNGDWVDRGANTSTHTLVDGVTLPADWAGGGYTYISGMWARTADGTAALTAALAITKTAFIISVDVAADLVYDQSIGNRAPEYADALTDAQAYKTAGYTGTPPASVQSWSNISGLSLQGAADNVIGTAAGLKAAQMALRTARLTAKASGRAATTQASLDTVAATWATSLSSIRRSIGLA